ncbi:MAG: hypothetical protein ACREID_07180, partial [Planctomycetota bacterium]
LLRAERGQRVLLRPMDVREAQRQLWVSHVETDPDPGDPARHPHPLPYVAVGLADRQPQEETFLRVGPGAVPMEKLGAVTPAEWLVEIRLVRESGDEGRERNVIRMQCGQPSGGFRNYFFDPLHPVPPLGWYRQEAYNPEGTPEVYFASPVD